MITATQVETSGIKASYNLGYVWLISVVAAPEKEKKINKRKISYETEKEV